MTPISNDDLLKLVSIAHDLRAMSQRLGSRIDVRSERYGDAVSVTLFDEGILDHLGPQPGPWYGGANDRWQRDRSVTILGVELHTHEVVFANPHLAAVAK